LIRGRRTSILFAAYWNGLLTLVGEHEEACSADDDYSIPLLSISTYFSKLLAYYCKIEPPPRSILQPAEVLLIACGNGHCLLGTKRHVFSLGSGTYGQLGLGSSITTAEIPRLLDFPNGETPRCLAVSDLHSCVVTSPNGYLYTFGCGAFSRLGHTDDQDFFSPHRVDALMSVGEWLPNGQSLGIAKVACSLWHTVVLATGTHDVFCCGWNNFGQCGNDLDKLDWDEQLPAKKRAKVDRSSISSEDQSSCEMIRTFERIVSLDILDSNEDFVQDIACGHRFTAFLTNRGNILITGQLESSEINRVDLGIDWWARTFAEPSFKTNRNAATVRPQHGLRYLHIVSSKSSEEIGELSSTSEAADCQDEQQNPAIFIAASEWSISYVT
jgi:alpha-tubulin suppressor-like RCC1 family protein